MSTFAKTLPDRRCLLRPVQRACSFLYFSAVSCAVASTPLPGAILCFSAQGLSALCRTWHILRSRVDVAVQAFACAALTAAALITGAQLENDGLLLLLSAVSLARGLATPLAREPRWRHGVFAGLLLLALALIPRLSPDAFVGAILVGFIADHALAWVADRLPSAAAQDAAASRDVLEKAYVARSGLRLLVMFACCCALTACLLLRAFTSAAPAVSMRLLLFFGGSAITVLGYQAYAAKQSACDPTNALLLGLLLHGTSLLFMDGSLLGGLLLCGLGCGLCCAAMSRLLVGMHDAARFLLGDAHVGWPRLLDAALAYAGLVAASVGVVALLFARFALADQPSIIPVTLVLLFTAICAAFFPLSRRYLDKLTQILTEEAAGHEHAALRAQLTARLTRQHTQPLIVHLLVAAFHCFYPQKTLNIDRVRLDTDDPPVFLCNHGDLHGPIAAYLTIPTFVRPWSISTITADHETAFSYLYKYDWSVKTWMPIWLRKACAHAVASFALWGTGSLECIPVFRDHPVELRKTFRASIDAMAAGDPLLIFPENPNAAGQDHGYETTGVGELFSGFAMVASGYYNRTGKRCRFIPMFAHQPSRTVAFGTEIVFDPDNDPSAERQRISDECATQMKAMCADLDARMGKVHS